MAKERQILYKSQLVPLNPCETIEFWAVGDNAREQTQEIHRAVEDTREIILNDELSEDLVSPKVLAALSGYKKALRAREKGRHVSSFLIDYYATALKNLLPTVNFEELSAA